MSAENKNIKEEQEPNRKLQLALSAGIGAVDGALATAIASCFVKNTAVLCAVGLGTFAISAFLSCSMFALCNAAAWADDMSNSR